MHVFHRGADKVVIRARHLTFLQALLAELGLKVSGGTLEDRKLREIELADRCKRLKVNGKRVDFENLNTLTRDEKATLKQQLQGYLDASKEADWDPSMDEGSVYSTPPRVFTFVNDREPAQLLASK